MRNIIFSCMMRESIQKSASIHKRLILALGIFCSLLFSEKTNAQFTTPTIDGTLDGANYPTNYTSGSSTWHVTWDNTYLYVFLQNANETEPVTLFLDVDPIVPVNGGSDSNGTLVGLNYDGYSTPPNLPFRADVFIYSHNGYREIRRRDGANGWTSLGGGSDGFAGGGTSDYTGNANGQYASNNNGNGAGSDDRREFKIAWSRLLGSINSGNRPASFNWMGYASYSNGMYAQVPFENYNGSAVSSNSNGIKRYFTVSSTANGTSTNPFGRNSYTHPITATDNSFGAINVWDFTMNSPGQQIARLNSGGDWNIGNNLVVNSGIIYFGSGGSGYGTTAVAGNLNLLGGTLNMDQTNKSLDVSGNINIATGANLTLSGTLGGDLKTSGNWTRAASSTFNPNGRAVLFNGNAIQTITRTGGGTETFNYLNIGGSGTLKLATGTDAIVNANNGLTLASSNATSTLDLNGQSLSVTGGGNLSLASNNRKVTSTVSGGIFSITTNAITIINPGTVDFDTNTTIVLETGCNFGAGNPTTINGTLQLNMNAFVNVNAPKYGPLSLLKYNSGGSYDRRVEWNSTIGGSYGVPHHIIITNTTTLNYPFGSPGSLGMTGNLTIDSGSKLYMDYGAVSSNGPLTVMGNIVSAGDMTLGTVAGNDLKVAGNVTFNTGYSFDAKNRAVFFLKNGTQIITAPTASPPTFHYVVFQPSSGSTTVQLNTDLTISAPNTGNVISFNSANDIFDLNGKTLTLGTSGINNLISGTGTFKGSTTSGLTLLGNGSIGTVNFTNSFRTLGTLTVNRENATTALNLGTDLTIHSSLSLTKGLIFLGTSNIVLTNTATHTGASSNSYVISDVNTTGRFRKNINGSTGAFTYPIGDRTDSANGSNYTPATISFTNGTFSSTASVSLGVSDAKHPEMQATTDYLSRYWRLTSTGITGDAAYTFSGKYHSTPTNYDVVGTESNSISGRWNGTQWTEGTTIGTTANTLEISVDSDATSLFTNDISAGYPLGNPEINVVGNNLTIASGDTTPSSSDFTDFGNSPTTRSSTFLIQNLVTAKRILTISNVTISGAHASDFSITTIPASSISVGGTSYLVIKFAPSAPGLRTATVTIYNNDSDESIYTFDIQGQGIDYTECSFGAEEIIAIQDFEDTPATPSWGYSTPLLGATVAGGTGYGKAGDNGTTQTSNAFIGAKSLQVNNATAEIIFDAINTLELSDVNLSLKVAALSNASGTSGLDNPDYIIIQISKDNGVTWTEELSVNGNTNSKWGFTSGTGIGITVYDGNGTIESFLKPLSGGYRTTDGYSTLNITNLPLAAALKLKLTILNNAGDEIWAIDNITLKAKRKASKTWNGTAWSGDGNPPTSSEIAIINGDYDSDVVGSGFVGCKCEIISGATLTVATDDNIDIESDFINNGVAVFEDSSSLLQHNDNAVNTGNVTIKRNTQPVYRYDFTYWSSPLFANEDPSDDTTEDAFTLKQLSPMTMFDKYYKWNHAASPQAWQTIPVGAEVMVPGRGYIVRAPQNFAIQGASGAVATVYTANFIGTPNNGIVEHEVTGSSLVDQWNLLGNPYPSALDMEKFLSFNAANLEGTIYLWTHNSQIQATGVPGIYSYNPSDYATFNFSGSTATAPASTGGPTPDEFLASGQSFFVKGLNTETVVFNNSMRVAGNNDQFFRPGLTQPVNNWQTTGKHRIWLNLTGQNAFNQTLVGYIQNATNELDWGYDGDHFGGNKVSLYSIAESKNLAIQGRALPFNNQDLVPLGYKTSLTGTLTINIDHFDGLFEDQDIYLEDLDLNVVHDLKASNYTFTTVPGTFNNRFVLRYIPQQTLSNPDLEKIVSSVIIFKDGNELKVKSSLESINTITVYDILGRRIFSEDKINGNSFTATDVVYDTQTLIVKVQLKSNAIVTKKVIY
ncbi:choice-of-anchor D domain-containing protein [Flavobacterium sp. PLA-1-15]|uniref:choice-of-anchor D domain-containing protein n=1 Tax=Flavobacterium sp. PLA-1-15 TaxID=3380533 RepID=UPI003B7FB518